MAAPQGYLVCHHDVLLVPTGRGAPAGFDARSGAFLWHENGLSYKPHYPGGSWVTAYKDWVLFKRRRFILPFMTMSVLLLVVTTPFVCGNQHIQRGKEKIVKTQCVLGPPAPIVLWDSCP